MNLPGRRHAENGVAGLVEDDLEPVGVQHPLLLPGQDAAGEEDGVTRG
jgi:hypothetical protein